jgi:hypothetical protein
MDMYSKPAIAGAKGQLRTLIPPDLPNKRGKNDEESIVDCVAIVMPVT